MGHIGSMGDHLGPFGPGLDPAVKVRGWTPMRKDGGRIASAMRAAIGQKVRYELHWAMRATRAKEAGPQDISDLEHAAAVAILGQTFSTMRHPTCGVQATFKVIYSSPDLVRTKILTMQKHPEIGRWGSCLDVEVPGRSMPRGCPHAARPLVTACRPQARAASPPQ